MLYLFSAGLYIFHNYINVNYTGNILEKYDSTKRKLEFKDRIFKYQERLAVAFSTSPSVQFRLGHFLKQTKNANLRMEGTVGRSSSFPLPSDRLRHTYVSPHTKTKDTAELQVVQQP